MTVTTIKRCQSDPLWYWTVEDCNVEVDDEPGTGLLIKYHDVNVKDHAKLSVCLEDALLIRDAINQLYPPDKFPAK